MRDSKNELPTSEPGDGPEPTAEAFTDTEAFDRSPVAVDAGHPAPAEVGRYRIVAENARGGMGAVYRAHDPVFGREVAIKILAGRLADLPSYGQRFLDEARITGQLQHPGIPPVHEVGIIGVGDNRCQFGLPTPRGR